MGRPRGEGSAGAALSGARDWARREGTRHLAARHRHEAHPTRVLLHAAPHTGFHGTCTVLHRSSEPAWACYTATAPHYGTYVLASGSHRSDGAGSLRHAARSRRDGIAQTSREGGVMITLTLLCFPCMRPCPRRIPCRVSWQQSCRRTRGIPQGGLRPTPLSPGTPACHPGVRRSGTSSLRATQYYFKFEHKSMLEFVRVPRYVEHERRAAHLTCHGSVRASERGCRHKGVTQAHVARGKPATENTALALLLENAVKYLNTGHFE